MIAARINGDAAVAAILAAAFASAASRQARRAGTARSVKSQSAQLLALARHHRKWFLGHGAHAVALTQRSFLYQALAEAVPRNGVTASVGGAIRR